MPSCRGIAADFKRRFEFFAGDRLKWPQERFKVIALRDLARHVDDIAVPADPMAVIERRQRSTAKKPAVETAPGNK